MEESISQRKNWATVSMGAERSNKIWNGKRPLNQIARSHYHLCLDVSVERESRKLDCNGFRSEWDGGETVIIDNSFKMSG